MSEQYEGLHTFTMPDDPNVKIRVGDQWVDITNLGDMLIEAGEAFNRYLGKSHE